MDTASSSDPASGPLSGTIEAPSGKGAGDENFPVGSWLIRPDLRHHVHAFYRFARIADDIADSPTLAADDKVERLARMGAFLTGACRDDGSAPATTAMRRSLAESGVTSQHCLDLLKAFTQDATKTRYTDWQDLMDYCYLSAAPVGRHLLDLHGESRASWAASDALCNLLQVINHLQDCGKDRRDLDRVYVPAADFAATGAVVEDLDRERLTPEMRATLDRVLAETERLLPLAATLPAQVRDRRLSLECAVIYAMGRRITAMLRTGDPLATRVKLGKGAAVLTALGGLWYGLRQRGRPLPPTATAPAA